MNVRGKYIVIEGPDGIGKTTQAQLLVEELKKRGTSARYVHEPGETAMGLELEKIIKNRELDRSALTELLLFTANRIELYNQVIAPALENNEVVVADRNWLSSVAYQGVARKLGITTVREVTNRWLPTDYTHPDFTALVYMPDDQREAMLANRGTSDGDYFETQPDEFQEKIRTGYELAGQQLLASSPKSKEGALASAYISAAGSIDEVHARIVKKLEDTKII